MDIVGEKNTLLEYAGHFGIYEWAYVCMRRQALDWCTAFRLVDAIVSVISVATHFCVATSRTKTGELVSDCSLPSHQSKKAAQSDLNRTSASYEVYREQR